jgi:hypothetical protein
MKATFALVSVVTLTAACACVGQGSEVIIKQRAKELSNQNNVRQGVPPPTQAVNPASGTPVPAPPALAPSLTKFQTDLAAINTGSTVTLAQKEQLANELLAGAQGAKPSPEAAAKLASDLAAAFAEKPLSSTSRTRLVREIDAVLNPGKYPQAKLEGIFSDVQAIFQENGLSRTKATVIVDDLKAVSADVQKGGVK